MRGDSGGEIDLPNVSDDEIKRGLSEFTGLPHRLKFVAEKYGVKYYDDSISTTPGSAIAALKAFAEPKILILGGSDKGADYSELAKEIARQNVRLIIINGANADEIREVLREEKVDCEIVQLNMAGMKEVAKLAKNKAQSGDVVILSPAAASFDMFKSYSDRGEQFVAAVEELNLDKLLALRRQCMASCDIAGENPDRNQRQIRLAYRCRRNRLFINFAPRWFV